MGFVITKSSLYFANSSGFIYDSFSNVIVALKFILTREVINWELFL